MTRRERMLRIIESFGGTNSAYVRHHIDGVRYRRGLAAYTDSAVEEIARDLVRSRAHQNKYNAEHRKRMAAQ